MKCLKKPLKSSKAFNLIIMDLVCLLLREMEAKEEYQVLVLVLDSDSLGDKQLN